MTVHLRVVDVTSADQTFRCERLHAVVTGALCAARHTATRRVNAHHGEALYPDCSTCHDGRDLAARLAGVTVAPTRHVAPTAAAPQTPQLARCTYPGCVHPPLPVRVDSRAATATWCKGHRQRACELASRDGVDIAVVVARMIARALPHRGVPCPVPGCEELSARPGDRCPAAFATLCAHHRHKASLIRVKRGVTHAEAAARVCLPPAARVADVVAAELAEQDRIAVRRAEAASAQRERAA